MLIRRGLWGIEREIEGKKKQWTIARNDISRIFGPDDVIFKYRRGERDNCVRFFFATQFVYGGEKKVQRHDVIN